MSTATGRKVIEGRGLMQPTKNATRAGLTRLSGLSGIAVACLLAIGSPAGAAVEAPPIRIGEGSAVPACVTPERLMAFLRARNPQLEPRFARIAHEYRRHGEAWRVRWDYAFYQMAIETNFLSFRRPDGRFGDVNPRQNNFAGLGTTGGGVPGDSYPDVATGVLAQIQHLVVYSGEPIANPIGARTRLKQDVILKLSEPIAARRPVTYQDLSGRWAVDRAYGRSINWVASQFAQAYCRGGEPLVAGAATRARTAIVVEKSTATRAPAPASRGADWSAATTASALGAREFAPASPPAEERSCRIQVASYGGSRAVLVRRVAAGGVGEYTVLSVLPGFESELAANFIRDYAAGGAVIATHASERDAMREAQARCPSARS